jgi:hypothetical protein
MEVLITLGLLGVAAVIVTSIGNISLKGSTATMTYHQADQFRKMIIATLQNDQAWKNTVNDPRNTSLACIKDRTTCLICTKDEKGKAVSCVPASGPFRVMGMSSDTSAPVYDPLVPKNGFTMSGAPCDKFSPAGNDQCPLRLELEWAAACSTEDVQCLNPQIKIHGKMLYSPSPTDKLRKLPFNPEHYGIDMIRGDSFAGNGAENYIPKWVSPTTLGNSNMYQGIDGIGIGTIAPASALDVAGGLKIGSDADCTSTKAGTMRWNGTAFEGCFANGQWCALTGCDAAAPPPVLGCTPGLQQVCATEDEKGGQQTCGVDGNWSTCVPDPPVGCSPAGKVQACTVPNGAGNSTCLAGGSFSDCVASSCSTGFHLVGGNCVALVCKGEFKLRYSEEWESHKDDDHWWWDRYHHHKNNCEKKNPFTNDCSCADGCKVTPLDHDKHTHHARQFGCIL